MSTWLLLSFSVNTVDARALGAVNRAMPVTSALSATHLENLPSRLISASLPSPSLSSGEVPSGEWLSNAIATTGLRSPADDGPELVDVVRVTKRLRVGSL